MLNGLIVVNKEKNITSFGTIKKLEEILGQDKIGHVGTLDPNATGVLVCLLNDSCKFSKSLSKQDKIYEAELIFGFSTDTLDIKGKVIKKTKFNKSNLKNLIINLDSTLKSFIGDNEQIPPMVSAKKVNGKKLYELARKNISIDRKPCKIIIYDISIKDNLKVKMYNNIPALSCKIIVKCSQGTYIRSLCEDIGKKLKINSCMGDLKRISVGDFNIKQSLKLSEIKKSVKNNDFSFLKPCYYQQNNTALSIGKFETLHLGHMEIINRLKIESKKNNLEPLIFTFNNNSSIVTNEEKLSRLFSFGINNIISIPFDKTIMNLDAEYFYNEIIKKQLRARLIVCGSDFCFGKNRLGDINFLNKMCKADNIELIVLDKILYKQKNNLDANESNGLVISSSNIKKYITDGNFSIVNNMLGRCYGVIFKIIDIKNLEIINIYDKLMPKSGTYNVFYYKKEISYDAKLVLDNNKIFLKDISDTNFIKYSEQIKIYFKNNEKV